jgi:hypothetical protein
MLRCTGMVVAEEFGGDLVGVVEAVAEWLLFRDPNTPPRTAAKIIANAIAPPIINNLLREARGAGT